MFTYWVINRTERVLRDRMPPSILPPGGQDSMGMMAAAGNETRSFQICVRSTVEVPSLTVVPGPLTSRSGTVIATNQAKLYRQHQIQITNSTYRNSDFRPNWYSDALIPALNPMTGQPTRGRLSAVPFFLPPDETHAFWIDVKVPAGTPAGKYVGVYLIMAGSRIVAKVPVTVRVYGFDLPTVPSLPMVMPTPYYPMKAWYTRLGFPQPDWAVVERQCAQEMMDHRLLVTAQYSTIFAVAQPDGTFLISDANVALLRTWVDAYNITAIQAPHPSHVGITDAAGQQSQLREYVAALDSAIARLGRPKVMWYFYLKDEPSSQADYDYVRTWAAAIKATGTKIKVLVTEQPDTQNAVWGDLYGAVDIWCPLLPNFVRAAAARRQMCGETVWAYTAMAQGTQPTPWWATDFPLMNYRVPFWQLVNNGVDGMLYYAMCRWVAITNPWAEPATYTTQGYIFNGDGNLVYPGRDCGFDGVCPSIRLKALRDGLQDYEYLTLADRMEWLASNPEFQASLTEAARNAPNFQTWERDSTVYDRARDELARLAEASPYLPSASQRPPVPTP